MTVCLSSICHPSHAHFLCNSHTSIFIVAVIPLCGLVGPFEVPQVQWNWNRSGICIRHLRIWLPSTNGTTTNGLTSLQGENTELSQWFHHADVWDHLRVPQVKWNQNQRCLMHTEEWCSVCIVRHLRIQFPSTCGTYNGPTSSQFSQGKHTKIPDNNKLSALIMDISAQCTANNQPWNKQDKYYYY
jgi:hypothetical protein